MTTIIIIIIIIIIVTRIGMYVCFGFAVDRLRRARTIDLQCQSLSLSSFLLCNVPASVSGTVERDAVRWPARPQNRSKIIAKIDRKLVPGSFFRGAPKIDPKSILGRSRDASWRPRASRRRLRSVSGASRGVPGAPRECPGGHQGHPGTPKSAPGSVQERAEATKIDAKSGPGAKKSSFGRATCLQRIVEAIVRRFLSIFGFFAKSANPPKYYACQQKQRFGPSRCESSRSCDVTSQNVEN